MSRVDAVRIALEKAQKFGHDLDGSVLASDAFFPFADGPRARSGDAGVDGDHPARRLEARRRGCRCRRAGGSGYGLHRAAGTSGTDGSRGK